ncbi:MAG: hypothetical protein ABH854_02085 [Candidatus Diapherotrites archaeon]|nr:hypothetical protein [Candidatus Micrarchaeota archaeon]MBU1939936.1 hypothetical protein [Candidatus Micrarchaeota archaeon]
MGTELHEKKRPLDRSMYDFIITSAVVGKAVREVVEFSVLQIYSKGEKTQKIIMFDTAHGCCHVHRFCRGPHPKAEKHLDGEISARVFRECIEDVKKNWGKYGEFYFRRLLYE